MDQRKLHEKIRNIEKEIKETTYHKGTERHIGLLKAKLAILKKQVGRKGGGGGEGFAVSKQGDATVVLVGKPSVGKSTLLNKITGAESKIGHYPFTTLDVVPGTLQYKDAQIQIFDVPGMIQGASKGKGGGKEILSVVRIADLLLLMASSEDLSSFELMENELYEAGVRLNKRKPNIQFEKKGKGGITIQGNPGLPHERIESIAQEFRLMSANFFFGHKVTENELIDTLVGNRVYVPYFRVITKGDLLEEKYSDALVISSKENEGLDELKERIFQELQLMRIYLREGVNDPPQEEPVIARKGETMKQVAERISNRLAEEVTGARLKGPSAQFPNQQVGLDHKPQDGDQVFFIK